MTLYLECKPDETLALALGWPRKTIVHSHSKGRVARGLAKHPGAIGLVDQDFAETEPRSLQRFAEISTAHDVRLRLDRENRSRLVEICPRLEPWLLKTAKASEVVPEQFGLSSKLWELDRDINHRLPDLERLLQDLIRRASPRLVHLRACLLGESSKP